jgi:hypothetical protein
LKFSRIDGKAGAHSPKAFSMSRSSDPERSAGRRSFVPFIYIKT